MALALAQAGADIILTTRQSTSTPSDPSSTHSQILALGRQCTLVDCDLSSKESVRSLASRVTGDKASSGLGLTVDILVNCGGIQRRTPAENFPDEDWEEVIQVNLAAVWTLSRDFGRHMLSTRGGISGEEKPVFEEGKEGAWGGKGNGKIINVASLITFQGEYLG